MKKVLFITTRLIYPVNDGRKVVLYNYCKGLVDQHNCEVRLFSLVSEEEKEIKQPDFISEVYYGRQASRTEKIKNIVTKSLLQKKWPLQVSLYYSSIAKKQINEVINNYEPDVVICDMVRTAEYARDLSEVKYNKILDMDDILSKRYKRQLTKGTLSSEAVGTYSKKLPNFINKLMDNEKIMRFIIKKEVELLSKYEISISRFYRKIVFVSKVEAKEFNNSISIDKSIDITIGVDFDYFSEKVYTKKKENYIVFLGNMFVAHNKDAVRNFLNNIFPSITNEVPSAKFRIVGKCSDEFKKELSTYDNIEITGEVEDIRPHIQECSVAIAPLTYGSGIKTKILETMAMGVPVVTNDIGVEGIDVIRDTEIIICNNNKDFSDKIIEFLKNQKLREVVASNAQKRIFSSYKWNTIIEKFDDIL